MVLQFTPKYVRIRVKLKLAGKFCDSWDEDQNPKRLEKNCHAESRTSYILLTAIHFNNAPSDHLVIHYFTGSQSLGN